MTTDGSTATLVLVDLQARLMPAIDRGGVVLDRCALLGRAARLLGIPVLGTEQNPAGLGGTVDPIAGLLDRKFAKMAFDATADAGLIQAIDPARPRLAVAGCEAHVCVLQTVLGLRRHGFAVAVAADGVGSRRDHDRMTALRRMERSGAEIVTAEMLVFEWTARCDHPRFKGVLALVR